MNFPATVLIASKGRPAKLLRCIRSIPDHVPIAIHATCPADIPVVPRMLTITFGPETPVQAWNLLATSVSGNVLPACDDLEFEPACIDTLATLMDSRSGNAVIGANITNKPHNQDAVVLVGRQIIEERGFLFYPEFRHFFVDYELGRWARSSGRFLYSPTAHLLHHHPEISGEYDLTHRAGRMDKWRHDKAVWDRIKGIAPAPAGTTAQT